LEELQSRRVQNRLGWEGVKYMQVSLCEQRIPTASLTKAN
jgi:hypothetical protein